MDRYLQNSKKKKKVFTLFSNQRATCGFKSFSKSGPSCEIIAHPCIRVSTFFEIAIDLVIFRVQIGIKTQCKKFVLNIEDWIPRGDVKVFLVGQKHDFTEKYTMILRKLILVSIDSEIPVFYLFVIH